MFRFFLLSALLAGCDNFEKVPQGAGNAPKAGSVITREQAMVLASRGNCLTCHRLDSRLAGPAWREVSAHYGGDPRAAATIALHIKKGGSFGWNLGYMPMRGEGQLSDAEIDALAGFIATLK